MELCSTHSDVKKTDLVDDKGAVVYRTSTSSNLITSKTTIARFAASNVEGLNPATVAAEVVWHKLDDDEIVYHGRHYEARNFIPNHGFTTARDFKAPSGRAYYWAENVLHTSDGAEAAKWHNQSHGIFISRPHQAYLHIADMGIQDDMDIIILTLVYHLSKSDDEVAGSMLIVPFSKSDDAAPVTH